MSRVEGLDYSLYLAIEDPIDLARERFVILSATCVSTGAAARAAYSPARQPGRR